MSTTTPTTAQAGPAGEEAAARTVPSPIRLMFIVAVNKPLSKNQPLNILRNQVEQNNKSIANSIQSAIAANKALEGAGIILQTIDSYLNIFTGIIRVTPNKSIEGPNKFPISDEIIQALFSTIFSLTKTEGGSTQSEWQTPTLYPSFPGSPDTPETADLTWSLVLLDDLCDGSNIALLGKKGIGLQKRP